jgi:Reverse transcriptase (RNA-dependent DNA polymerase)
LLPNIRSRKLYRDVIDALAKKWAKRGRLEQFEVENVSLAELLGHSDTLARKLAKTVASGEYRLSPLVQRHGYIGGKHRVIYRPNLLDAIVLSVLARYLTELFEPELCNTLHSFRKGHSAWKALDTLCQYVHAHRNTVPLRERGLYVLRRDVTHYGESLDVSAESPFNETLNRLLKSDPDAERRAVLQPLVLGALRQPVLCGSSPPQPLPRGIPTGSPIQPPFLNLYLASVDRELSVVPDAFYARFGDDILFVHPNVDSTVTAAHRLENRLSALGLSSNSLKSRDLFFNGAGRPAPTGAPFEGVQQIEYLGASVGFSGQLSLKSTHFRRLILKLRERLQHVAQESIFLDQITRIELLCEAARRALNPRDVLVLPGIDRLFSHVNDRSQMIDFDFRVAQTIAELITRKHGVRAFRELPKRELRGYGAPSLVAARNRRNREGAP